MKRIFVLSILFLFGCVTKENILNQAKKNDQQQQASKKGKINALYSFDSDSTSFSYSKYVKIGGITSTEEWLKFDSINHLESINIAVVDFFKIKDSLVLATINLFTTLEYDTSYVLIYDVEQELFFNGLDNNTSYSIESNLFIAKSSFVVEINLLDFDFENGLCYSNSIHKQFRNNSKGQYVEENYSIENKSIDIFRSKYNGLLFKDYFPPR